MGLVCMDKPENHGFSLSQGTMSLVCVKSENHGSILCGQVREPWV